MSSRMTISAVILLASCLGAACEDRGPGPLPKIELASLVIENQSQYDLLELRVHGPESYRDASNVLQDKLQESLAVGETFVFHGLGARYVTVFRERNRGGPVVAISTTSPVSLAPNTGYGLLVFDESFRVERRPWIAPVATTTTSTNADPR